MTEYTVHFQKGREVGTRSLYMAHVEAEGINAAIAKGKAEFAGTGLRGYRLTRVDHIEETNDGNYCTVRDF